MKRREFITGIGSAVAWPLAARAQQGNRVRRVGVLMNSAATSEWQAYLAAFIEGLRQLGWADGPNLRIDVRWNDAASSSAEARRTASSASVVARN
jgi:putative ABC transport system substrate-binding protein